ncbi:hypothetical protein Tco_0859715 [Tanacetum coccineum]|uniref:Xylulose kinase-1 n=1 Tax=Tanacetum coccineum TaxID=301880 RepID=A0ABQ5BFS7_9ASTR
MIAFLEKPAKSNGFQEIIDFLNANQIYYALTVNPTIYASCIEQFWATSKPKMVNGERQLQALVDKKKVIITELSIRSDLHLEDAGGIDCLPTATIFEELARMGYEKPSQRLTFYKTFFSAQWKFLIHTTKPLHGTNLVLEDMSHHKKIYVNPSHVKKIFANMKREGKDFSGRVTPLFATIMVQTNQEEGVDSSIPTDSQQTPITTQPSSSRPQKKQSRRKQRKETKVPQDKSHHDDSIPIPSNDPLLSSKGCSSKGDCWFKEEGLKVGKEKKKSRTTGLKRLRKVGESRRVESSKDKDSLDAQEDASNQGRSFKDIDKDAEVSLVDETQGRIDDAEMFDTDDLHGDEVIVDMAVAEKQEQSAKIDEITLAQTLIEIKVAKPKAITTAATTTTTTRPKARGVVVQEPIEFRTTTSSPQASQPSNTKDKGKAIMIDPEVPLKRKDQVALDEEIARNLKAQLQAELIEEERLARKKEEEANIALIES